MPVLDTSFLIDLQEGLPEAVEARDRLMDTDLVVPAHAAMEFLAGIADAREGLRRITGSFRLLLPDEDHIILGARLRLDAARRRARPGWGDVHIAAAAAQLGTFVVTADPADFRALRIDVWDYRNEAEPPTPA